MKLSEYIKYARMHREAPSNTQAMAQSMERINPIVGPQSKQKTMNQSMKNTLEIAQHPSPYIQPSETLSVPNQDESNPSLREHIRNYKTHATKVDKGSLNKRSYV